MDVFQPFVWYFIVFLILAKWRMRNSFLLIFTRNLSSCLQKTWGNEGALMHFVDWRYRFSCNGMLFIFVILQIWSSLPKVILNVFPKYTRWLEIFLRSKRVMIIIIIVLMMERSERRSIISILKHYFTRLQSILLLFL